MLGLLHRAGMALIALCAASTLLMALIGSVLPAARLSIFNLCELPCIAGIQPGKTDFADALETLRAHFQDIYAEPQQTSPTAPLNFSAQLAGRTLRGTVTSVGDRVRSVTINDSVRLLDLLAVMESPSCVYTERVINDVSTLAMVQWRLPESVTATAFLNISDANPWQPYATVRSFRLSVTDVLCRSGRLEPHEWQGFPRFWRFRFVE